VVLRRDSSPFATSSLQDGEDKNFCALGNLGRITDHRGHLDAAKVEEHADPDRMLTSGLRAKTSMPLRVGEVKVWQKIL
jgi:hypothetical protein